MAPQSENDEGRPAKERPRNVVTADTQILPSTPDSPRCRACGHAIWSDESIAVGVGRDCRRARRVIA